MKALTIDDQSVSGMAGLICHIVLDAAGHTSQFINAPLVYDAKPFTSYTPEMADLIVLGARELKPDWVMMVLQGRDSSGQMAVAAAIHQCMPTARFVFISGSAHTEELERARLQGLKFLFIEMPVNPEQFLAGLEKSV